MMRYVIGIVLLLSTICSAGDFDYWLTDSLSFTQVNLNVVQQIRFSDDSATFIQYTGLGKKLNSHVSTAIWHKYITTLHTGYAAGWNDAHRVVGDLAFSGKLSAMKVSNRSRLEYGLSKYAWIYRNKTKLSLGPVFISDEVFFLDGLRENRLIGGVAFDINESSKLAFFCMERTKKYKSWNSSNILGATIKIRF